MKKILLTCALLFLFPLNANAETEAINKSEDSTAATEQTTTDTTSENQSDSTATEESSTTATSEETSATTTSSSEVENVEVKDIEKAKEKTIKKVEKEMGVKKTDTPVNDELNPDKLRETLKDPSLKDYFTEKEINNFSDQQLTNAMTLCMRMSGDTFGLDIGGYARIVNALYKDKTLSWDKIENILNFDPNSYSNAIEMIDDIDSLQAYLNALYPSDSSFMAVRKMSREELINVLKYISPIQEEMIGTGNSFFPGIIAWISRYADDDDIRNGVTPSTTTNDTNSGTTSGQSVSSTNSAENKAPADDNKNDKILGILPKTGEERKTWLTVAGVIILALIAFIMVRRNRKK
ncbi:LPXTG cell wall anchor domain-containing protein [Candidatus Enterococcus murrayae]|uniref:LPXTG cell wall anchor domain-containing protein n=1 Tax=Candidatus Enterococcus murrayae TaxID=2815321 RepID=A0ABS3HIZ4_9ENTE|nr:LPXTG cell wall anchor domain-containing protein [Enterococcus sp. MJM16]MBO0452972.1 LPXTG cell wall anchor domain-containing protein [Enterococcus sp. MJM16]